MFVKTALLVLQTNILNQCHKEQFSPNWESQSAHLMLFKKQQNSTILMAKYQVDFDRILDFNTMQIIIN